VNVVFVATNLESFEAALEELAGVTVSRVPLGGLKANAAAQGQSARISSEEPMAVKVEYDPALLPFERLLDLFWGHHDPRVASRELSESGPRLDSAVVYYNDEQRIRAIMAKIQLDRSGRFPGPVATVIVPAADLRLPQDDPPALRLNERELLWGAPGRPRPPDPSKEENRTSP
jgi:peptide methionine sulfoxide reductase MsrA